MFVVITPKSTGMKLRFLLFLAILPCILFASQSNQAISLNKFRDGIHHWNLLHSEREYDVLDSSDVISIANNLVAWQNEDGGWPKNIDWLGVFAIDSVRQSLQEKYRESTLDNKNIWPQIAYLSEAFVNTKNIRYRVAAEKGFRYLLKVQNTSGGWRGWDVDAITFNDEVMTGIMNLFLDVKSKNKIYAWIKGPLYTDICKSLDKAVLVTLQCQIEVNGVKTAWCQQHDHVSLAPVKARSYELPSITAKESCDVLIFLMRIKSPNKMVVEAIESGVKWLEKSRIEGIKLVQLSIPASKITNTEYPYDLQVKNDPLAPPLWARFYEINTNESFMCTRQGKKVHLLSDVEPERRVGYEWYGSWPNSVFPIYDIWQMLYGSNE